MAPVIYAAHIAEEVPGYERWFNSLVTPGIGEGALLRANVVPCMFVALLAGMAVLTRWRALMLCLLAWISFFMFANAVFHVMATLALIRYSPGVVTATVLYLPFCFWFARYLITRMRIGPDIVALIALLAGLPMYLQTYMVVFQGKRFY